MLAVFGDIVITIGLCDIHIIIMAIAVKAKICTQSVITLYKSICAKATQKPSTLQRMIS